jgi:hypothetical protein
VCVCVCVCACVCVLRVCMQSRYIFGLVDDSLFSIYRMDLLTLTAERTHTEGDDWDVFPQDRRLHTRSLEVRATPNWYPAPESGVSLVHFGEYVSSVLDVPRTDPAPHGPYFYAYKAMFALNGATYRGGADEEDQFEKNPIPPYVVSSQAFVVNSSLCLFRVPRDTALCLAHVSTGCYVIGTANGFLIRSNVSTRAQFRVVESVLCGGASAKNLVAHDQGVVAVVAWPEMSLVFSAGSNDCRLCAWDARDLFRERSANDAQPKPIWEWRGPSSFDRLELAPISGSVQYQSEDDASWIEDTRSMWLVASSTDGRCLHIFELANGEDASTWRHLSSMSLSCSTTATHCHPPRTILYPLD